MPDFSRPEEPYIAEASIILIGWSPNHYPINYIRLTIQVDGQPEAFYSSRNNSLGTNHRLPGSRAYSVVPGAPYSQRRARF
jgi:hypothetical protein